MTTSRYGAGGATGRRIVDTEPVTKRYRDYNPEHRRQRRVGMGEATLIGGGGTAAGFGAHGAYKDTKALRALPVRNIQGKTTGNLGQLAGKGALKLTPRNAALLLGGGAALGGASALRRWAEGNRGRAYN